ncbi:MAG: hypothetical protein IKW36_06860 [Alistipes sp.]|nr:hypothetical protein [Alistipes sp.]
MVSVVDIVNALRADVVHIASAIQVVVRSETISVGNNSVAARCSIRGIDGDFLLKCYYRHDPRLECIYGGAYRSESLRVPTLAGIEEGIDTLIVGWIEGITLSDYLADCAGGGGSSGGSKGSGKAGYTSISRAFDELALEVLSAEYAHGDISPDNIIIVGDAMRLIDLDTRWEEAMSHAYSTIGTPRFTHRHKAFLRNKHIDDFAIATLSTLLAALATYDTATDAVTPPNELLTLGGSNLDRALDIARRRLRRVDDTAHYEMATKIEDVCGHIDNLGDMLTRALRLHAGDNHSTPRQRDEYLYGGKAYDANARGGGARGGGAHNELRYGTQLGGGYHYGARGGELPRKSEPWCVAEEEQMSIWLEESFSPYTISAALHRNSDEVASRAEKRNTPSKGARKKR